MVVHIVWFIMSFLKNNGSTPAIVDSFVNWELGLLIAQVCDSRGYFNETPVT